MRSFDGLAVRIDALGWSRSFRRFGRKPLSKRTRRVGIAPLELIKQRTIDIASGRRRRLADEPRIWFASLASLAQVLSEPNRVLLEIIRSARPTALAELAERSGRHKGNLSRTLKTMEHLGVVRLERQGRTLVPIVDCDRLDIEVPLAA